MDSDLTVALSYSGTVVEVKDCSEVSSDGSIFSDSPLPNHLDQNPRPLLDGSARSSYELVKHKIITLSKDFLLLKAKNYLLSQLIFHRQSFDRK